MRAWALGLLGLGGHAEVLQQGGAYYLATRGDGPQLLQHLSATTIKGLCFGRSEAKVHLGIAVFLHEYATEERRY